MPRLEEGALGYERRLSRHSHGVVRGQIGNEKQVELTGPWEALKGAGADLELVSIKDGEIQGFNHYDKADKFKVDKTVEEVSASDYDALVLPGGVSNPDALRLDENAVHLVASSSSRASPSELSATRHGC